MSDPLHLVSGIYLTSMQTMPPGTHAKPAPKRRRGDRRPPASPHSNRESRPVEAHTRPLTRGTCTQEQTTNTEKRGTRLRPMSLTPRPPERSLKRPPSAPH